MFDAQNPAGEMFGRERVHQLLRELGGGGATAQAIVDALDAALTRFIAGARVKDDVTVVVMRVLGS